MNSTGIPTLFVLLVLARTTALAQMTDVLTYHNDNARTGQTLNEEILTSAAVTANHFGKLWVLPADGKVDAQPLYAAGISLPGVGTRNALFVATEHDSVYAYDADRTNLFWKVSLLGSGETSSDARGCGQVSPEIGITATPVIDRQLGPNGTIFLVAMSKDSGGNYHQRIHALDLATGTHQAPPATIAATYPGTGANSSGGNVIFNPAQYKERPGLLLLNGVLYTAWSSHCDFSPYTGWIMGYNEQTLAQTSVLNITPNGSEGAIWMSGAGLAADAQANIYFLAGNGTFDTTLTTSGFPNRGDFGNSFMKLSTGNNQLAVADYFATYNTPSENSGDQDLGSGGALVLPDMMDSQGNVRQLAVGAGKDAYIYLVDRSNMGKFNAANDNAIYQKLGGFLNGGIWSMPAYFNGTLYFGPVGNRIRAFPFQAARLSTSSSQTSQSFAYPGATPSISANGTNNAILWATENTSPAVLHAYAASNLAVELYNSNQAANGRDHFGSGNKFITPTIASARVYVGTTTGVGVLGLLDSSTLTPVQTWRNSHFGNPSNVGAGANDASPAGDDVANLMKYALGLDPFTRATRDQLPRGSLVLIAGQSYAVLTVNRTAIAPDVSYLIEVSGDLQNWTSGPPNTVTMTDIATQLVVRDASALGANPRFMRLRVIQGPSQSVSEAWVGAVSTVHGNGGTGSALSLFSLPMISSVEYAGQISSLGNATLTDTNAIWADGQFNGTNGNFYVELTNGWTADISTTTAASSTLSLASDLRGLASAGSRYRVRQHFTIARVFGPTNAAGLKPGLTPAQADNVLLVIPEAQQVMTIFYYDRPPYAGWYRADYSPAADQVIRPAQGLMVERQTSGDLEIDLLGLASAGPFVTPVQPGYNLLGTLHSLASLTPGQLDLYTGDAATGLASGLTSATADNLLLFDTSGTATTLFYYKDNSGNEGWYDSAFQPAGGYLIGPGSAFFVVRKSPNGAFSWLVPSEGILGFAPIYSLAASHHIPEQPTGRQKASSNRHQSTLPTW